MRRSTIVRLGPLGALLDPQPPNNAAVTPIKTANKARANVRRVRTTEQIEFKKYSLQLAARLRNEPRIVQEMNRLADEIVGVSAVSTALVTAHVDRAPVREEQKKDSLPEGSSRMYLAGVGDEIAQGQPMRALLGLLVIFMTFTVTEACSGAAAPTAPTPAPVPTTPTQVAPVLTLAPDTSSPVGEAVALTYGSRSQETGKRPRVC